MDPRSDGTPDTAPQPSTEPRWISSQALLGASKELVILHNGRQYRLRLTQNGRLILTA